MRSEFKKKCKEMMFDVGIDIEGNLNVMQQRFVRRTIRTDQKENFDFNKFKRGYYRIIASKFVKTFYPSYSRLNDSLFRLKLKATLAPPLSISIGGNISSSSLNQGYLGVTYSRMTSDPWKVSLDMNIGKYYSGAGLKGRYDIGVRPLAYLFAEGVIHQFDYFSGNQNIFTPDRFPSNAMLREYYFKAGIATPLNINKNILAKLSFVISDNRYIYFTDNKYFKEDSKDVTNFKFFLHQYHYSEILKIMSCIQQKGEKGLFLLNGFLVRNYLFQELIILIILIFREMMINLCIMVMVEKNMGRYLLLGSIMLFRLRYLENHILGWGEILGWDIYMI
jgi:hypothetical protein